MKLTLGKPQLHLKHVKKSLEFLGSDLDYDEIDCILANLVFSKKVRGYISHKKRILVLSKKNAFPTSAVIPK